MGNLTRNLSLKKTEIQEEPVKEEVPKPKKKNRSLKPLTQPSLLVPKPKTQKKIADEPKHKGRIFMFFGEEGTGKSYACDNLARIFGKTLYLDTENKADEILDEKFEDMHYDIKRPIIDDEKKFSEVFSEKSDFHIIVVQKIDTTTGKTDNIATTKYIMDITPKLIHLIKSGRYKCVILDSVIPIWNYAMSEWLYRNRPRKRPNQYEYAEVEAIKQEILFPFINICRTFGVHLIFTGGITGHYVADQMIGYRQDAKAWLLHVLTYEIWCSRDFKKYVIKHPYRPFWEVIDEDLNIGEYLFDKDFIEQHAVFKNFEDFKYEELTSEEERKERGEKVQLLKIGSK